MKRITIILILAILLAKIASGQELFFPDSNLWEMTINEDFNTNNVSLTHYKDHNKAKIEKDTELPALLMDSNVYVQNGVTLKLKAQKEVFLEKGFEVENGGVLEVNTNTNN